MIKDTEENHVYLVRQMCNQLSNYDSTSTTQTQGAME